jgi:hypothetical protein
MKRLLRPIAAVSSAAVVSTGLLLVAAPAANAAVLGEVSISPLTGTDSTLFGGTVTAACPAGTADSYWSIDGPDLPADQAILAPGNPTGTGAQSFSGASIANLKSANAGSFSASGSYFVRFNCVDGTTGLVSDTYQSRLDYTAGGAGAYSVFVAPVSTTTTLSHDAGAGVEAGVPVTFTADVNPDNAAGAIEFWEGTTLLGTDNTLSATGGASFTTSSLAVGTHSVFAKYVHSGNFTDSQSAPVSVVINPVAARSTTSALTVNPTSGNAYQAVTLSCAVTASTGTAVGNVNFLDGATAVASNVPVDATGVAATTTSSLGAGSHSLTCAFVGTAPYQNSTSAAVPASYTQAGATPWDQNVTVSIPQGALVITTPYTTASPLALGTAVLDPATSTYSASAVLGTAAAGYITITDTRAGNLGWNASLVAGAFSNGSSSFPGSHAGLTGLGAVQVGGNALQASNVVVTNHVPFTDGLGSLKEFARYGVGLPTGSANITGTFGVAQVPTSITPGLYTSTVTFTAV